MPDHEAQARDRRQRSIAAPVAAGTFEDAVDAHARGDYAKALRLIRRLTNDGDASAQFNLGLMYTTGHGVRQDNAGFGRLQTKATALPSFYQYANGKGVPQD